MSLTHSLYAMSLLEHPHCYTVSVKVPTARRIALPMVWLNIYETRALRAACHQQRWAFLDAGMFVRYERCSFNEKPIQRTPHAADTCTQSRSAFGLGEVYRRWSVHFIKRLGSSGNGSMRRLARCWALSLTVFVQCLVLVGYWIDWTANQTRRRWTRYVDVNSGCLCVQCVMDLRSECV